MNKRKLGYFRRTLYCLFFVFLILSDETIVFGFIKYKQRASHQLVEIVTKKDASEVQRVEIINNPNDPPHFFLVQPNESVSTTSKETHKANMEELIMNGDDQNSTTEETPEEPMEWPSEPERRDEAEVDPRDIRIQNEDLLNEKKP